MVCVEYFDYNSYDRMDVARSAAADRDGIPIQLDDLNAVFVSFYGLTITK